MIRTLAAALATTTCLVAFATPAAAQTREFNVPAGSLRSVLDAFARQSGRQVIYRGDEVRSARSPGVRGARSAEDALNAIVAGSGFTVKTDRSGALAVVKAGNGQVAGSTSRRDASPSSGEAVGGGAAAGDAGAGAGPRAGDEEIIVTARRRDEKIMDVPIAITVVTQKTLAQNNVQTIGQLQFLVPSLSTTSVYTRDSVNLSIRGQQSPAASSVQAVVAYINEVPIPTVNGGDLPGGPGAFVDLAQVEVLKGPQGTLFGRNTTGGAVLFKTAPPKDSLGASLQLGYGNYNNLEGTAVLNVPLSDDKLLMRVAAAGQLRDGFTHVISTPDHPNGIDADNRSWYSLRGSLSFRPSSEFQNDLTVSYSSYKSNGSPTFLTAVNPSVGIGFIPRLRADAAQQQALGARVHIPEGIPLVSNGTSLAIQNVSRLNLSDNLTLKNIAGFVRATSAFTQDYTGSDLNLFVNIARPYPFSVNQYSEEIQLLGKAFDNRLDWIVGAFGLKKDSDWTQVSGFFGVLAGSKSLAHEESKALFAQGTYDLSPLIPNVKFTAGARYTWDDQTSRRASCTAPTFTVCGPLTEYSAKSSAFTWNLSLDWEPSKDTLIYLASRRGYRAGGFNTQVGAPPSFGPEYVTDVELGVKGNWNLGGMPVQLVADGYWQNYSRIQVIRTTPNPADPLRFVISTQNAGSARVYGAEIEASIRPTPELQLGATFSYLDFKYTSFLSGVDGALLTLEAPYNRPRFKYGLNGRYQLPLDESIGEISLMANWSWQSATVGLGGASADHDGIHDRINSFGILNLSMDWSNALRNNLDISLYMSNVTNKLYAINQVVAYNSFGYSAERYGEPRMYGLRLKYRFGSEGDR